MNVVDLHIEEIFEETGGYFRLTIQAGAVKIQGRLLDKSLIYLMQGVPTTLRDADVSGWIKPKDQKRPVEIDAASFNLREVEWL